MLYLKEFCPGVGNEKHSNIQHEIILHRWGLSKIKYGKKLVLLKLKKVHFINVINLLTYHHLTILRATENK